MLVILMSRVPVPGCTKTRLQSHLSGEECGLLHEAFIKDMISMVRSSELTSALAFTPISGRELMTSITEDSLPLFPQKGENLGERMQNCVQWGSDKGFTQIGLMGTDMPNIQPSYLKKADELLDRYDVVIGPAFDGGYCFIGMKRAIPEVFGDLSWGKGSVLKQTVAILDELKLSWSLLPKQRDIDVWEDLVDFRDSLASRSNFLEFYPIHTSAFLLNLKQLR